MIDATGTVCLRRDRIVRAIPAASRLARRTAAIRLLSGYLLKVREARKLTRSLASCGFARLRAAIAGTSAAASSALSVALPNAQWPKA
jgi:hypothetical protein